MAELDNKNFINVCQKAIDDYTRNRLWNRPANAARLIPLMRQLMKRLGETE